MGKTKPKKTEKQLAEEYAAFLKKALSSANFKSSDPVKYEKTKKDYDKVKLRLKLME